MAYSISDLLQSILELSPQDSTTAAATQNTDADHSNRRAFGSEMASGVVYPPVPTGGFISSDSTRDALDQNDTHFLEQSTHTWAHRSLPHSGLQPQGAIIHVSHPNSHRSTLLTAASSSHPTSIPGARAIGSHLWMPDHPSAGPSSKKSSLRPSPSQHDGSSLQEPAFGGGATLGDNPAVAPSPSSNTRRPGTGVQHSHPTSQPPQSFASLSHPLSQAQSPAGYYRQDYSQPSTSPTYMPSLYGPTPIHPQFSPHSLSHQHQQRHSYASSPYGLGQSPAPPMISQHHSFQQPYTHPSGMVGVPLPPELGVNMPDRYSSVMSHMPMYPRGPYSPHSLAGESPSTSLDAGRPPSPSTANRQRGAPMVPPVTTFQPQSNHSNPAISNPPNSPHAPPGSTGYHYASTTSPTYAPFFPYHLAGSPAQPSVPFSPYGHGSYYGTQHSPDDGPPVPHPGPPAQPQSGGWWYMPPQAQQPGGAGGGSPYEYSGAYFGYPVDVAGGHIMSPGMVSMHQISSVAPSGHNPQRSNHVPITYPHPPIVHTHSPTGTFSRDVAGPGGNQPPPSGKSDNQPDGTTVPHSELGPERTPAAEGPSPRRTSKSPRQKTPTDDPKENATSEMQSAHSTTQSGRPQSQRGQGQRRFGRQQQTSQQTVPATKKGKAGSPIRRAYHPNPPTQRSEWVMWVGNVPADATQDELWRFFNDPFRTSAGSVSIGSRGSNTGEEVGEGGVSSVFLISQSNCAFVNFDSQSNLERAIATFNGRPLRSSDPRCPKLVCRIRRKDDDLRAGVGGQRGMGMHTQWIKAQAEAMRRSKTEEATKIKGETKVQGDDDINVPSHFVSHDEPPTSPSSHLGPNSESGLSPASARGEIDAKRNRPVLAPLDPSVRLAQSRQQSSTSSGSYASTTSSFLTQYFPQRYFILKSLTEVGSVLFHIPSPRLSIGTLIFTGRPPYERGKGCLGNSTAQRTYIGSSFPNQYRCLPHLWGEQDWGVLWVR
ncbi:hypothetical protein FRC02_006738 [Tulasnella sp. 418]|nr:hypothetical protein FRC02_006738 [Tulasnella sp. 418]